MLVLSQFIPGNEESQDGLQITQFDPLCLLLFNNLLPQPVAGPLKLVGWTVR